MNALLFGLAAAMETASPFEQYLQREALPFLSYPLKANTVPSWTLLPTAYALPAVVFVGLHAAKRLERRDTAKLVLGLFFACSLTLFVTNTIKLAVGCAQQASPNAAQHASLRLFDPLAPADGRGQTSPRGAGRTASSAACRACRCAAARRGLSRRGARAFRAVTPVSPRPVWAT
jgi:hypothetical protein